MPFVERRNGEIAGVYANPQPGTAEEWLEEDDPDVIAFMTPPVPAPVATPLQIRAALRLQGKTDAQIDALFSLAEVM